MFQKLIKTEYPPEVKPIMVFDGNCGFCKYWIVKWKKLTEDSVEYIAYQEIGDRFLDIDIHHFKQAVRYIQTNGNIVNGPDAAYVTYFNQGKLKCLHNFYNKGGFFMRFSDWAYQYVADHRNLMFRISKSFFGSNPNVTTHYWVFYLMAIVILCTSLVFAWLTNT